MTNIGVQIISDTICPWCYVGYRRLTRAITTHKASHPSDTFTLNWQAFYLNAHSPTYPGINKRSYYEGKFGADRTDAIFLRLASVGEGEGIAFNFGGNSGNTRDSHRVVWFAGRKGGDVQSRVVEGLFRAYFEEEKNITDREVLIEAAVGGGLEREEVERFLESEEGGKEVDEEAGRAGRRTVTGVPHFTIQGQYVVEGASTPEVFLEAFNKVKQSS